MIMGDFSYFKTSEAFEHRIEQNVALQDLDEEFRENNIEILTRFYLAFESIHKFILDLNRYLDDVSEGIYIQQTLESLIINEDAKQLFCEALFLYGIMLLVVDMKIDGVVRERLLVSYYRYSGAAKEAGSDSNIDDVCKLLRSTGFSATTGSKRPVAYPENYFSRVEVNTTFVSMVTERLLSDDVYNQISAYPHPKHRSSALATQSSMLYVCLYFQPKILQTQQAKMREIVDKYFPDNWVISLYMGIVVNLIEAWEPYKAAKAALNNSLATDNCKQLSVKHSDQLKSCITNCRYLLKEGILTEQYLLDNVSKIMNCLRDCNVTLRWLMLHTITSDSEVLKKCRQMKEMVNNNVTINTSDIFSLLLYTAELELKMKEMFSTMLDEKEKKWSSCKQECVERLQEVAEVFSGAKPLTRVQKNDQLKKWFEQIANEISTLDYDNSTETGRKIIQLIEALQKVQAFHQLDSNMQIRQFLDDTVSHMHQMIRIVNIKEEVLITIEIVADLSYAWVLMDKYYTPYMQEGVKKQPQLVIKLRATFLKLASSLDLPLLRINQANSGDLMSVSQYYSGELVAYFRKVLQIIPKTMFSILSRIVQIQTQQIPELPTRLEKDKMKEFAQLDARYEIAKLTHEISVFTEGITMMKTTLVGVIKIDPKQLLEDGIRKELVLRIASSIHQTLTFNPKSKTLELKPKLDLLVKVMSGFKRSFEYIQDYVNIYGLKIWQEEMMRIINYNVEQECNTFLRQKVQDYESIYQSKDIPIPRFAPTDPTSHTFIGRLAREILRTTDSRTTTYVETTGNWYDCKSKQEVLDNKIFSRVLAALGSYGLSGLDRLYRFMTVRELQNLTGEVRQLAAKDKTWSESVGVLLKQLQPTNKLVDAPSKVYPIAFSKSQRVWQSVNESLARIGQIQIICCKISSELNFSCKFHSKPISAGLNIINKSLMTAVEKHYEDPANNSYPSEDNPLMFELTNFLDLAGMDDPLAKIYITTKKLPNLALICFLSTVAHLQKVQYNKFIDGFVSRKLGEGVDSHPFLIGIITTLRQFHNHITIKYLEYLCQYICSYLGPGFTWTAKTSDLPQEVVNGCFFLESFLYYNKTDSKTVESFIPSFTLAEFRKTIV